MDKDRSPSQKWRDFLRLSVRTIHPASSCNQSILESETAEDVASTYVCRTGSSTGSGAKTAVPGVL
jgi:hypothetical protein